MKLAFTTGRDNATFGDKGTDVTLYFYNNEPSKNKHFLILFSSLARNSKEPILKISFQFSNSAKMALLNLKFTKYIPNMSQGPQNPKFRSVRVE